MITRQRVSIGEAESCIRARLDFSAGANTLRGYTNSDGDYIIKSYDEVIVRAGVDGSVWITGEYFSNTTSRHLAIAKRGIKSWATDNQTANLA